MRNLFLALGLAALAACSASTSTEPASDPAPEATPAQTAAFLGNAKCPVSGNDVKQDVFVEADGEKAYFCCGDCKAKHEADPKAALAAAYPEAKPLGNTTCPVSGEEADGSKTVSWQGHAIAVCCGNCVGEFPNDAAAYATKAAGAN